MGYGPPYMSTSDASCSIVDLYELSKRPRENCAAVLERYDEFIDEGWTDGFAYVLFSDLVKSRDGTVVTNNGTKLVDYIKEHGLGTVNSPRQRKNPNTGNIVKVWLWSPNMKAIRKVV